MKPYEGVTVCDFTHTISGPVCTHLLGGLGAEIIKIEPPNGEMGRDILSGGMYEAYNHNKKSISIDLKNDKGLDIAHQIATDADIIIENFASKTMDKFELHYDKMKEKNPEVIYCSMTGFGQSGPYSQYPAYDPVVQAMSGIMDLTGPEDGAPSRTGISALDVGSGILGAFLISSSLLEKKKSSSGRYIDLSLFDTAIYLMSSRINQYYREGSKPQRQGAGLQGSAPYDTYPVNDEDLVFIGAGRDTLFSRLCTAINREDLNNSSKFNTRDKRWSNRNQLRHELVSEFKDIEAETLVEELVDAGVPAAVVRGIDTVAENDPHVEYRNMIEAPPDISDEETHRVSTLPFHFKSEGEKDEPPHYSSSPPDIGEHTIEILSDVGISTQRIVQLCEEDAVHTSET